jgi:chromosome segregation ATPase
MARASTALSTLPERVSVVEVKIENMDVKLDDIKDDVKELSTNLTKTLAQMQEASTKQHGELAGKIKDLETVKNKWTKWGMIALAFAAGAGWIHATTIPQLLKFLGI